MKTFRISLDPNQTYITPGQWPATRFEPNGYIERQFSSAEVAVWEIADEFGINPSLLKAVEV